MTVVNFVFTDYKGLLIMPGLTIDSALQASSTVRFFSEMLNDWIH